MIAGGAAFLYKFKDKFTDEKTGLDIYVKSDKLKKLLSGLRQKYVGSLTTAKYTPSSLFLKNNNNNIFCIFQILLAPVSSTTAPAQFTMFNRVVDVMVVNKEVKYLAHVVSNFDLTCCMYYYKGELEANLPKIEFAGAEGYDLGKRNAFLMPDFMPDYKGQESKLRESTNMRKGWQHSTRSS